MIRYISLKEIKDQKVSIDRVEIWLSPVPWLQINEQDFIKKDINKISEAIKTLQFNVPVEMSYSVVDRGKPGDIDKQKKRFEKNGMKIATLSNLKLDKPFTNVVKKGHIFPHKYEAIFSKKI